MVAGGIELTVGSQPKGFGVVKREKIHHLVGPISYGSYRLMRRKKHILVIRYTLSCKGGCGFCLFVSCKGSFEDFGNWVYNFGVFFLYFLSI